MYVLKSKYWHEGIAWAIDIDFVADVKCGLYEINKNNRANSTHGPSPVHKMFWDWTEAMLDQDYSQFTIL